jgi:heat shock protein HslJ
MKVLGLFAAGFVAACAVSGPTLAGPAPGAAALEDIEWKLARLGTGPVALGQNRHELSFVLRHEGRRVVGFTGCNQLMGRYLIHGHKLILGQLVATQKDCPGRMPAEVAFINALHRVRAWAMAGEQLTLFDTAGQPLAVFEAGPAP